MYDKIKISVSEGIARLLKKDAEDFRVLKPKGDVNMNAFLNTLVMNYYEVFAADEREWRERLEEAFRAMPRNYAEIAYRETIKAMRERQKDTSDGKNIAISFKPTKVSERVAVYIEEVLLDNESISSFYRRMFVSYAQKNKTEREKIIHKENYELLSQAARLGFAVCVMLETGEIYQDAAVYAIAPAKDEFFNYALLYSGKKNRTVRLSKLRSVSLLPKKMAIPEPNASLFARQVIAGAQYPMYSTDNEPIRVQLSSKGKKLFEKIYLYRPTPVSVEGDVYTFECSANQVLYYFERFGEEALILTPKRLGIFMRNYYYYALKKYRTRYDKE